MRKALITNDDSYRSAGIRALIRELSKNYQTIPVAPAHEQSWVAKSMTRNRKLTIKHIKHFEFEGYIIDGTPADCTQLGLYNISETLPEMVVSGINVGSNVGYEQILSSGTIGAAFEAALQHVPAFAVATYYNTKTQPPINFNDQGSIEYFATSAEIARKVINKVMLAGFPSDIHVISINIPWGAKVDCRVVVTKPHQSQHDKLFLRYDNSARHQGGDANLLEKVADDSDMAALEKKYVSVTPITIELTSSENQQILSHILGVPVIQK